MFDKVPEGDIILAYGCDKHGVSRKTGDGWFKRGEIPDHGRIIAPARGGGYKLTSEEALVKRAQRPRRRGRPPKCA